MMEVEQEQVTQRSYGCPSVSVPGQLGGALSNFIQWKIVPAIAGWLDEVIFKCPFPPKSFYHKHSNAYWGHQTLNECVGQKFLCYASTPSYREEIPTQGELTNTAPEEIF